MNNVETTQSLNPLIEQNKETNTIKKASKNFKSAENQKDLATEAGTTISNLEFLQNKTELNLEKQIPKDTISTSTGTESNSSQQDNNLIKMKNKKLSFSVKTKQWAGNVWNSIKKINIKNMFPKTEYEEYRNANGDIVKIPKKKIPLKKKTMNNNVSKKVTEEQNKIVTNYHGAASGLYIIS